MITRKDPKLPGEIAYDRNLGWINKISFVERPDTKTVTSNEIPVL